MLWLTEFGRKIMGFPSSDEAHKAFVDTYGKRWVVRDLDLEVPQGSVTALLGRNGVGKSTTIQMLLGLLRPSQGSVRVLGLEPQSQRHRVFRELAYVSERRELLEDTRVSELAKIVAEIHACGQGATPRS